MGISDAEAVEQALSLIRKIITQASVVRVVYRDGKWAGPNWNLRPHSIATLASIACSWRKDG
jgi:hypothetical protein